ncbi:MAG: hypothetical protein AABZ47_18655 [Planctomycetota bacterium]
MRKMTQLQHSLVALLVWAMPALGGTRVLCLGPGRGYDAPGLFELVLVGESMQSARQTLEHDGFSFTSGELFEPANLVGYDIVVLGLFDPEVGLSATEQTAIDAFVRQGGALIYLGDNDFFQTPNVSVAGMYGLHYRVDPRATYADIAIDPTHPILRGLAGVVGRYDGAINLVGFFGGIDDLGVYGHAVLRTPDRTVIATVERNVLQPGSGPVVFVSETSGFVDAPLGSVGSPDNLVLLRNIFAFVSGPSTGCAVDRDCDDGLFCNGLESCAAGRCVSGEFPCSNGQGCNESTEPCGPCVNDGQCDDDRFCNGVEVCHSGVCEAGTRPCLATQGCDEETVSCGLCNDNSDCDDGLFCNGFEDCDASGACRQGLAPCGEDCERCDETTTSCEPCLLDVDGDGVIGTGDFGFFAGCFGACYANGHECLATNFDSSADGCVGTGDFAAFSGCFGGGCGECGNCGGPGEAAKVRAVASALVSTIRLVAVRVPSTGTLVDELPTGQPDFAVGDIGFIEVWASLNDAHSNGFAAAYVDMEHDPLAVVVETTRVGDSFLLFHATEVDRSKSEIRSLGGCAAPGERRVGVDSRWVLVGTVQWNATVEGVVRFTTASAGGTHGVSLVSEFGNVNPDAIDFGGLSVRIGAR